MLHPICAQFPVSSVFNSLSSLSGVVKGPEPWEKGVSGHEAVVHF